MDTTILSGRLSRLMENGLINQESVVGDGPTHCVRRLAGPNLRKFA